MEQNQEFSTHLGMRTERFLRRGRGHRQGEAFDADFDADSVSARRRHLG